MANENPHSVVVPVLNETRNPYFAPIVDRLGTLGLDVVYVDGGSSDETVAYLERHHCRVLSLPQSNRAQRLNHGINNTAGDLVLLHHPRSLISEDGIKAFASLPADRWGGFRHSFDVKHPILKFTSFYSNYVRFRRGIVYLDHCPFAPRTWLNDIGGVPELDIFEDTALSAHLRRKGSPLLLSYTLKTSAVRFQKNGIYSQSIMNQILKLGYYSHWSRSSMNRRYEKNLELNLKVRKD